MESHRQLAIRMMDDVLSGSITVEKFCEEYEEHFNFNWPARRSAPDIELFQKLFDVIVYYTPLVEDRQKSAIYRDEADVLSVVRSAKSQIAA